LCASSRVFNNAFNGKFKEAKDNRLNLRDPDPKISRLFLDWLSFRKVPPPKVVPDHAKCDICIKKRERWHDEDQFHEEDLPTNALAYRFVDLSKADKDYLEKIIMNPIAP
jgi:hypothetical protein